MRVLDTEDSAVVALSRGRERGAERQASKKAFHGPSQGRSGVGSRQKDFVSVRDIAGVHRVKSRHFLGVCGCLD